MKAIRVHRTGGPEVLRLEERPDPVPGPGELVLRVEDQDAFRRAMHEPVRVIGTVTETNDLVIPGLDPIGREMRFGGIPFTVIGVLEKQGSVFGLSLDRQVVAPYQSPLGRIISPGGRSLYGVAVQADNEAALAEARETVRELGEGDVVVIRYEGPAGGPGMREMLGVTAALVGEGLGEGGEVSPQGVRVGREKRVRDPRRHLDARPSGQDRLHERPRRGVGVHVEDPPPGRAACGVGEDRAETAHVQGRRVGDLHSQFGARDLVVDLEADPRPTATSPASRCPSAS